MRIRELKERPAPQIQRLFQIWESAVKETHLFLSTSEIEIIGKGVPQALQTVPHLIIAEDTHAVPAAFMGIDRQRLEMLFIAPAERGKGLGRRLLAYGIERYAVSEVTVNEQNPLAIGFYQRMGFRTYKRTPLDEQGSPYPLLYMKYGLLMTP